MELGFDGNTLSDNSLYKEFEAKALPINDIVSRTDMAHIQLTEVPKSYFSTIKNRVGKKMSFYSNLIQITARGNGIIFDLDSFPIAEVSTIEAID